MATLVVVWYLLVHFDGHTDGLNKVGMFASEQDCLVAANQVYTRFRMGTLCVKGVK